MVGDTSKLVPSRSVIARVIVKLDKSSFGVIEKLQPVASSGHNIRQMEYEIKIHAYQSAIAVDPHTLFRQPEMLDCFLQCITRPHLFYSFGKYHQNVVY